MRHRLFVWIPVPESGLSSLLAVRERLQDRDLPVRWLPPEKYGLTLIFLGSVDESDLPALDASILEAVQGSPRPTVLFTRLLLLPSPARPRVLAVACAASRPLAELVERLRARLRSFIDQRPFRTFRPHVTIARFTTSKRGGDWRALERITASGQFVVQSAFLMESTLAAETSRYHRRHAFPLG